MPNAAPLEPPQAAGELADNVTAYGIYEIDPGGVIRSWNPGAENLTGLRARDVLGKPYGRLFDAAEHALRAPHRNLQFVREHGHLREEQWRLKRDGSRYLARFTLDAARTDSGALKRFVEVVHDITDERAREQALYQQATRDALTGVMNRGHFMQQAASEIERALRFHDPLCLALLDIDYFKRVNDNHGHEVGDKAIILVANTVTQNLRRVDTFARVGGEEFAILLPRANDQAAADFLQRIRRAVADTPLQIEGHTLNLSISIGVTQLHEPARDIADLMRQADVALYRAKREGRNQVQVWVKHSPMPGP
ncbi:MAG: sensor domain-containing diguanylate cyclase [Pseudomonadota bacterium]|nr:sensor domain-containing diguanylate cyclase [Pseudomonadota bacterium]